jgi:NADH-quinone oxidoreductase subunit M
METIFLIFILFLGGAIVTWMSGKLASVIQDILFLATILVPAYLFYTNVTTGYAVDFNVGGIELSWGINAFGWLFSLIVLGLGVFVAFYAISYMKGKERKGAFYFNFILSVMAMLGILMSQDLVSFFIFWEIMTWSSYLMVVYNGNDVQRIGIKYFVFSAIGAYAMLMAIVLIKSMTGSFMIESLISAYPSFGFDMQILIPILLLTGFGVKAAIMPLHVWAPGAYSNAPMAYTSIFSGSLSKMGIYGMVIVFTTMLTYVPEGVWFRNVVAWLGGFTAVFGTLWAIKQDDAKKLLAYSSVAQLGYIIVGVAIGTPLSMMSGLFLAVMHGIFKGTLFMVVGAIERQTGTTNLTEVTGLIRKMPWTFVAALMSIIALAGIPPLGGFVGKWMLYESLITSDHYLLVIVIFFSSTAAFLYCYKFLFGFFLGQEEEEWAHVKEAPALMVVPMLILAGLTFLLGTYPGILLKPIAEGMQSLGYGLTQGQLWDTSIILNEWGNQVVLEPILYAIIGIFVFFVIFVTLKNLKNTRYVTTKDISSSGEVPLAHENLTFSQNFFQPFLRAVEPAMRRQIDKYYTAFANGLESLFDFTRRIYTGNGQTYAIFVIVFVVILLIFRENIFGL